MIIYRYLAKEILTIALAATLILFFIFVSNQLLHYLYYAAAGRVTASLAMQMLVFKAPELLGNLLPLSLFLAILLTYGRMSANNEMTILYISGVSRAKLFKVTMMYAVVTMVITAILMLWLGPYYSKQAAYLLSKGAASPVELISPGRFQSVDNGHWIFYAGSASSDHKKLYNVFVTEQPNESQGATSEGILVARKAYQKVSSKTGDIFIVFEDGNRYVGTAGQKDYQIVKFKQYWIRIKQNANPADYNSHAISTATLWRTPDAYAKAEIQWRLAMPIMALILASMAIPLSQVKTRKDRYSQLIPAILLYVVYSEFIMLCRSWMDSGSLSPLLGMWWVHGSMLSISALLNLKLVGWRRIKAVFKS